MITVRRPERKAQRELKTFPQPWIAGAENDAHKISPITDSRELYLASKAPPQLCQHLRARDFGVALLPYTVTNGDSRLVVMVEIARADKGGVALRQIKGYCNGPAPKDIERIVRRWFNRNKSTVRIPRSAAV
jgi:hypothetical protein